jgi:hypothetical protein
MAENLEERILPDDIGPATQDRLENFLSALFELKYNISNIEKKYPFLGSELSALCDQTLSQLSSITAAEDPSIRGRLDEAAAVTTENINPKSMESDMKHPLPPSISPVEETAEAHHMHRRVNPFIHWLDLAGGCIVTGLDRMGDFIISIMEKIFCVERGTEKERPTREHQTG